jgi:hypothetical protein
MYWRFCTRKRKVGDNLKNPSLEEIGKEICRDLCGATTGFLRPTYVVDAIGGRAQPRFS